MGKRLHFGKNKYIGVGVGCLEADGEKMRPLGKEVGLLLCFYSSGGFYMTF